MLNFQTQLNYKLQKQSRIKGDTASNVTKPATLETGLVVQVPIFINEGEMLIINTGEGKYVSCIVKALVIITSAFYRK